ncbi:hypothetical protein EKN06_09330 [Croceicoccus ponticola]|uniref:Uncharacterized protein n=1 Tax=Croceicoccus ponticola TaxID=2217664 RepID=A0A437GXH8_9SPHN|nr:hypothetical protein [Croceicoccus ponticola]RVQ67112.1 hypothetical protein EKN06_09330 [Croceicoccus ponticola]
MTGSDASAAQRFARFNARPEIQRITERYAEWVAQSDGCIINVQLSGLAMLRLAGRISRSDYRASIRKLASASGLPSADFKLLAECSRELARYMLSGSGQIFFTPKQWDFEEERL